MSALLERLATLSPEKRQIVVRQLDPLSFIQERLWFLHQLAPHLPVYNIPVPLLLHGPVPIHVLARSLRVIADRHEILRTTFPSIDGQPVQHVSRESSVALPAIDLTAVRVPHQDAIRRRVLGAEVRRAIDVEHGPLWRALLVRLASDRHVLMLTWHHLVFDGWSRHIFLRELASVSERLASGRPAVFPPLPVQYRHVARSQRARLQGSLMEEQLAWWRTRLGGDLPSLDLPAQRPRPARPSYRGGDVMFALPAETVAALRAIGRDDGITLFMALLAGWALLLQKYCGARDLVVGTVMSGRARPELEALIGCFVNTLALRVSLAGAPTVRQLLAHVREVALGAFAHQDVPFEKLVGELHPQRRLDETPLFRTWLMLENTQTGGTGRGAAGAVDADRLSVEELPAADRTAKFDLALTVKETADGVLGPLRYATDLFDRPAIVRLAAHLRHLFQEMAARPDAHVSELSLLTEAERTQMLRTANGPSRRQDDDRHTPHPSRGPQRADSARWGGVPLPASGAREPLEDLLIPAFEAQVTRTPEAIAMAWRDRHITFRELNRRANQLARDLRAERAGVETLVAVCVDRSPDLVVALLAILKTGAGFLPLDPALPAARLALILDDTRPRLVLTQRSLRHRLPEQGVPVMCLDESPRAATTDRDDDDGPRVAAAANVAYIIYTSGSTGRPKGVVIEHGALRNFLTAMDDVLGPASGHVWMATTAPTFDISLLELLWTLTRGAQIVLPSGGPIVRPAPARPRRAHTAFSLFYFASDADERAGSARYRLLLDGARFADTHGFSSVWMPERHFHSFGGIYPNPSVTAAAVAAITTRVKIRAGSVVLPLHDPIRVAEEWAVVDNLSDGRVGVSFASGWHANDFVLAPERYQDRRQAMAELMASVQRLWRGEAISRRGPTGQDVDVRIRPRPVQPELPVWITSGGSPDTFRLAGAMGVNLLTHLLGQTVDELAGKIALYRAAWREYGHGRDGRDGHVTLMLHTYLAEDAHVVRETVREPFSAYLRDSVGLLSDLARQFGQGRTVDALTPEDLDALVGHAFERYFGTSGLFGTPESALAMVSRLQEIGVDEVGCLVDFGIDADEVIRGLHHLARLRELVHADADLSVAELMIKRGVTHLQCTPTWARMFLLDADAPRALAALTALLVGGEALPADLVSGLQSRGVSHLQNLYGPTETTIWSSTERIGGPREISIGRPIANTQMYVLDRDAQVAPDEIPGDLFIGGSGVARGYWARPDLTAERFVPDPFSGARGGRLYRTGDRARWGTDRRLDFLGRTDHQVKLRGRRIELPEIEAALRGRPGVRDAVALVREDAPGDQRLVAYVVLAPVEREGEAITAGALQDHLRAQLPDYMVPSALIMLPALPMTSSGKIDRRALPIPSEERPALTDRYVAPGTPAEVAIARVWAEVLRLERVGIHDNFFALGGDSILSLQIVARALQAGWRLAPRHLFEHQTVAALAQVAQPAAGATAIAAEQAVVGSVPLLPIQSWFFEQPRPAPHHYNQQVLLTVEPATARALEGAWAALVAHHDALRLRFSRTESGWTQTAVRTGATPSVTTIDLQGVASTRHLRVWEGAASAVHASLNLEQGPVARPVLLIAPNGVPHLLIVAHHLVIDGVSWRVLLADLQQASRQVMAGERISLPPKTSSVRQWAEALRELANSGALALEQELWVRMSEPAATLPHVFAGELTSGRAARTHVSTLTRDETTALIQELPGRGVGRVEELLLSALVHALAAWTGDEAWRIDLEGHGRELPGDTALDVSRTIGWFTALYPVRLTAGPRPFDTLRAVKMTLRAVPHHGLGYGVLRYLATRPDTQALNTAPRAEIVFNYLGQFDQVLEPDGTMRPARLPAGRPRDRRQPREYVLEINSLVRGGHLQLAYTAGHAPEARDALGVLAERFAAAARALIAASRECGTARPWLVAADVPLANITDHELRQLAARGPVADIYPLSPMQQGLLFHSLYAEDRSSLYTIQFHSRVQEALDVEQFRQAWQDVMARHATLRTSFIWQRPDRPLQIVYETADLPCVVEDWRDVPAVRLDVRRVAYIQAEQRRGFELDRAPLMRVALLRLADSAWHIIWTAHHLIVDGWSVPLVIGEVLRTYHARLAGRSLAPAPAGQYADYIAWVQHQDLGKAEAFWRRTLAGFTSPSLLGAGERRDIHQTVSTQAIGGVLPAAAGERLHALGRTHALTLNTWLVGAWALVLAHYTRMRDVVFGTVVSGRPAHLREIERTVGVFANTLPMRVSIASGERMVSWLARIQVQQTDVRDYEHTPLGSIRPWSDVPAGRPLFDTLFLYENFPMDPGPSETPALNSAPAGTSPGTSAETSAMSARFAGTQSAVVIPTTFPLVLQVDPTRAEIEIEAVVDPAAIPGDRAQEILESFQAVVERITSMPDASVGSFLDVLADAERTRRSQTHERTRERNQGRLRRLQRT